MRKAFGLVAALAVLSVISVAVAQSRRPQPPAIEQATRALNEGRYDGIAGLLEKLDAQDPTVAALIARADIARGRYQPAETALRPIAQRAPTSDAALELGLLLQMLGRSDAKPSSNRVATVANTARDASDFARGARALRALGRFDESKAAYIDAEQAAPRDPAIETACGELFLGRLQPRRGLEVVPGGAARRFEVRAGAARVSSSALRRRSAAGAGDREEGARDQSVVACRCTCFSPKKPPTPGSETMPGSCCKRSRGEPVESRSALR